MNYSVLAKELGLEEEEFLELVRLFAEVSTDDLARLESSLRMGNSEQVREAAHSIKGAALNLGLNDISEIARIVEDKAREDSLEGVAEAVKEIRMKLDLLMASVNG